LCRQEKRAQGDMLSI